MISLAGHALLDLLSEPDRNWLASVGVRRSYDDGEMIHHRGDGDTSMCVVIAGEVRLTRLHASGTQTLVSLIVPGQHFGDVLFHTQRQRTHNALAVGRVQIDHYDEPAYRRVLDNPAVLRALHQINAMRLTRALAMLDDIRGLSTEAHLAKILLALGAEDQSGGGIDCVQEDLAGLLGTSVMTLSKSLATLKREGLIETGYRTIRIIDRKRMSAWLAAHSPE